jgi:hypothetical protein
VLQTPVWKTTYRLVIENEESARLQGWAIVENTGEFAWDKIELTLVSGRPISFQMDLYEPLYVQRPAVDPEVLGSPRPRIYDPGAGRGSDRQWFGGFGGGAMGGMGGGMGPSADPGQATGAGGGAGKQPALDPLQGVVSAAEGSEVGEFFQYQIKDPVSLAQRQSALLPIVDETVKLERLSVFTVGVCEKHPRHAFNVTNDTAVHLMSGPITVLDQRTYAGDARIRDLPPGQERLISYAVDLDVSVNTDTEAAEPGTVSAKLDRGILVLGKTHRRSHRYRITNQGNRARRILIEHPRPQDDWKLAAPSEPAESTPSYLRFAIDVKLEQTAVLEVVEERRSSDENPLRSMDSRDVAKFANTESIDMAVRMKLTELLRLRDESQRLQSELFALQSETKEIHMQQRRIRENMSSLDRTSPLYQRYVTLLEQQEGQLEQFATKIQITSAEIGRNELKLREIVPETE